MSLIYRIEDEDGFGCYSNDTAYGKLLKMNRSRHPEPRQDAGLSEFWAELKKTGDSYDWFFGYKDLDQLRSWMYTKQIRKDLDRLGLMISIYKVNDHEFSSGDTQAIFIKKNATLQGKLKLTEI